MFLTSLSIMQTMAEFYTSLTQKLCEFMGRQHIFFVATAPYEGRISLSPKGMDTFRIINPTRVAYLDLTGSGNETAAHLKENARISVMFCSFEKQPMILRLYGKATSVKPGGKSWAELLKKFEPMPGRRQIILLEIESLQTSCGYSIPIFEFVKERETLRNWALKKGEQGLTDYWRTMNQESIDGLPTGLFD